MSDNLTHDNRLAELKRIIANISFYNISLETHEKNAQMCRERLANLQQELLGWWSTVSTLPSDEIDEMFNQARAVYRERDK
jgi:hypothetical protein